MPRFLCFGSVASAWLVLAAACDGGQEPPAPPDPDKYRQCVEGGGSPSEAGVPEAGVPEAGTGADAGTAPRGCSAGEVCVQGRCHDRCTADGDCGPRETCGSAGACVPGSSLVDSGVMMDAGPSTPCDGVMCDAPLVCHPLSALCVECNEEAVAAVPGSPGRCSAAAAICDIANGLCARFGPAQCTPCNVDVECDPGDGSFVGRCVAREVMGWREQTCLLICDGSTTPCPVGLTCSVDGVCVPPAGASCTTWRAATGRLACLSDAECNIAGSAGSSVFFTQTCEGEVGPMEPDGGDGDGGPGDAGEGTPGTCVQPCAASADCFDPDSGQMCTDTGGGLTFCVVP